MQKEKGKNNVIEVMEWEWGGIAKRDRKIEEEGKWKQR